MIFQSYEPPLPPVAPPAPPPVPVTEKKPIRVVIVGDYGTGRDSLVRRFKDGSYSETPISVHETAKHKMFIQQNDIKKEVDVQVEVGKDISRKFPGSMYRTADAVLIVCDVTDKNTFNNVEGWKHDTERYASEGIPVFLAATKCDQLTRRVVSSSDLKSLGQKLGLTGIFEVSSKENIGIDKLFLSVASSTAPAKKIFEVAKRELEVPQKKKPSNKVSSRKILDVCLTPFRFLSRKISSIWSGLHSKKPK